MKFIACLLPRVPKVLQNKAGPAGPGVTYNINHPIVYREVVHECTLIFDSTNYRIILTISRTTNYVLAEYVHFGSPRVICHLTPEHPLTRNNVSTYHFGRPMRWTLYGKLGLSNETKMSASEVLAMKEPRGL